MSTDSLPDKIAAVNAIYFIRNQSDPIPTPLDENGLFFYTFDSILIMN